MNLVNSFGQPIDFGQPIAPGQPIGFTTAGKEQPRLQALRGAAVRQLVYAFQALLDLAALTLGATAAALVVIPDRAGWELPLLLAILLPTYFLMALFRSAYSHQALLTLHLSWSKAAAAMILAAAVLLAAEFAVTSSDRLTGQFVLAAWLLGAVLLLIGRGFVNALINHRLYGRFIVNIFVRDGSDMAPPRGYGVIDAHDLLLVPDVNDAISMERAASVLGHADHVLVACPPDRRKAWSVLLKGIGVQGSLVIPELVGLSLHHSDRRDIAEVPVSCGPLSMRNRVLKRLFDLGICVPLLLALSIPMAIVAVLIKLDSPGPVLFRQRRLGFRNRFFQILKFRTMRVERCDSHGHVSTRRDDDRITRIGRFLRASSLDELPQLINVVMGDMSLVGPRPHALGSRAEDLLFWEIDTRYWLRHAVKPGITGLAQIRGFRGATSRCRDLTDRLQADLEYLVAWSLWRDIAIVARTFMVLFHPNAY